MDARLIARINADLYIPCNAHWNISQSQPFLFFYVHHICIQLDWHELSSIIVYHFHSLAAPQGEVPLVQLLSARNISCGFVDARLIARFKEDLETPCHAQCNISQSILFIYFKTVHHMYNQLGWHALSSIIVYHFHSLAAPQGEAPLVQALSLQATSHADLWMQGSLLASIKTLKHPVMPSATFHSQFYLFILKLFITCTISWADMHWVP